METRQFLERIVKDLIRGCRGQSAETRNEAFRLTLTIELFLMEFGHDYGNLHDDFSHDYVHPLQIEREVVNATALVGQNLGYVH